MVEDEVLELNNMSVAELKEMWRQYFDSEPIWKTKRFYIPKLAYRMQELAYGGISQNIKNLLLGKKVQKASDKDEQSSDMPVAGTRIVKTYHGKEYNVVVSIFEKDDEEKTIEIVSSQSPNKRPDISTEEGRAKIQARVDELAEVFIAKVARNRGITAVDVVKNFGAGDVSVGQYAVRKRYSRNFGYYSQ